MRIAVSVFLKYWPARNTCSARFEYTFMIVSDTGRKTWVGGCLSQLGLKNIMFSAAAKRVLVPLERFRHPKRMGFQNVF